LPYLADNLYVLRPTGTVTFFFTDIEGSTRRWEADPSTMRKVLTRHDAILTAGIEGNQGVALLDRGEGDSFFAVFASAPDAVAAALDIQRALTAEPWPDSTPVLVRVAIHTGQAGDDYRGPDTNRAARIRAIAHGGQVLLSHTSQALASGALPDGASLIDLGEQHLKDVTQPERVFQLRHPDLPSEFPRLKSLNAFLTNLPAPLTSFVGRARELAELRQLVRVSRLVTLTGVGGTGKTRLAQEVARELIDDTAGGMFFVDLAPLTDADWLPQTVAGALRVKEQPGRPPVQSIAAQIDGDRTIVILDNCEQVVDACARLAETLLGACPQLSLICTSRERLDVPGEVAWTVPTLGLPEAREDQDPELLLQSESVRLFADRAATARPGFAITSENSRAVAEICRRLDGIPLAIELAAARVRALSPQDILDRLNDRFRLLTGGGRTALPRQQTLQATIDWSHDLLPAPEQALFRRLSVFSGGFDLDAAESVCGYEPLAADDVVDLIARLVDKSMLVAEDRPGGAIRYRMLDTLRDYGDARLVDAAEVEATWAEHLEHYAALAEEAYPHRVSDPIPWLRRLEEERGNLRAALEHAASAGQPAELAIAGALAWFWGVRGPYQEGSEKLERALSAHQESTPLRARAQLGAGELALNMGDFTAARGLLDQSLEAWRALGDETEVVHVLERLGLVDWAEGDADAVTQRFQQVLPIWRAQGNERRACYALMMLGQAACMRRDYAEAGRLYAECDQLARTLGDPRSMMYANHSLSDLALLQGDYAEAFDGYVRGLATAGDFGDRMWTTYELEGQAMAASALGRHLRAARLFGVAEAQRRQLGLGMTSPWWDELIAHWRAVAGDALGADTAGAVENAGADLELSDAVAYGRDPTQD
jgi:predicted ATPase/class 3 adenylate cyclase